MTTQKFKIIGQVQGVGFRPFIYRLAKQYQLNGWVNNRSGEVIALVQGKQKQLEAFQQAITTQHPPLAKPEIDSVETIDNEIINDFEIKKSAVSEHAQRHIPPDFFTCHDCLDELSNPEERRYHYPFINCTQCGPRYTIIRDLPYDRPNTSMQDFPLCPDCHKEYSNPLDRRFHAQPLACDKCGPQLSFHYAGDDSNHRIHGNEAALAAAIKALKQGKILATKGIGGYHLMCDALNNEAVNRLRQKKHRPDKPLAIMFACEGKDGLQQLRRYCSLTETEARVITSPQRPIVLVNTIKQTHFPLASAVHPGLNEIGAMLAYSPLHFLILNDFGSPIVATSGNLSGEPVLTDNNEVESRLNKIADVFLQHNRPILRPADDSVVRIINDRQRLFRIGRGMAPLEIQLPFTLQHPVLATGGQMKNTIALAWDNRAVISPHIGELDNKRSIQVFNQVIDDLCHLYRVKPAQIICDAHPDYYSSRYAKRYAKKHQIILTPVQHHKAHAGIICGEFDQADSKKQWLIFCWDGTGLGDDNAIWGGEAFYGQSGHWQRLASFKPFYLQGGDKAAKEPWRSACALLWETALDSVSWQPQTEKMPLAYEAWKKRINTIQCSSIGRLFDAASALLSLGETSSFEGQGPMQLEALLNGPIEKSGQKALPLYQDNHIFRADWTELLPILTDEKFSLTHRSVIFHECIAETLIAQAIQIRQLKRNQGNFQVGLSGGVFQNKHLTEYVLKRLKEENFSAFLPEKVPYNDAGLSFGQIIEGRHYET